jgi:hypothetical protein
MASGVTNPAAKGLIITPEAAIRCNLMREGE